MEIIIVILSVTVFLFWKKCLNLDKNIKKNSSEYHATLLSLKENCDRLENEIKENKKLYSENIASLEKRYKETVEQRNVAEGKNLLQDIEIRSLKHALDESERTIEFYKNITEASGDLNEETDVDNRNALLEQASKELLMSRNGKNTADLESEYLSFLDKEQTDACNKLEKENGNFFITGKAGTGKSFLLDVFRRTTKKSHIVLAPTGISALNVSGATLHSTFGYHNLVNLDVDVIGQTPLILKDEKKRILKNVSTIIIDEISMVRADTLDKIDRILKVVNNNSLPFGGKQMRFFGDLFQLPPVVKKNEYEYLYDRYGGIYFFCSNSYKNSNFNFIELTINHRQKDDSNFYELLNRIRDGSASNADLTLLNNRVVKDDSAYDRFTMLLPTKAEVEEVNRYRMDRLDSPLFTYHSKVILDKYPNKNHNLENIFPIMNTLQLKKGALIMMVANDRNHRWVNGTLGIVHSLTETSIYVAVNKRVYEIKQEDFTEQEITYSNGKIVYEDVFTVAQYPIVPAYAITIHKSQGQTYKNIICDIDRCFANGQAYVALSRCSSMEGLHLKKSISGTSIRVDRDVLSFYHSQIYNQRTP